MAEKGIRFCLRALVIGGLLGGTMASAQAMLAFGAVGKVLDAICSVGKVCTFNGKPEKYPELKRHRNFFAIANNSNRQWRVSIPKLDKNEFGKALAGNVDVYRAVSHNKNNTFVGLRRISRYPQDPGSFYGTLTLNPRDILILMPKFNGIMGSKMMAADCLSVVQLTDQTGRRLDFNLSRAAKPASAKTLFGYCANSNPTKLERAAVLLDPNFDDTAVIVLDAVAEKGVQGGQPF